MVRKCKEAYGITDEPCDCPFEGNCDRAATPEDGDVAIRYVPDYLRGTAEACRSCSGMWNWGWMPRGCFAASREAVEALVREGWMELLGEIGKEVDER